MHQIYYNGPSLTFRILKDQIKRFFRAGDSDSDLEASVDDPDQLAIVLVLRDDDATRQLDLPVNLFDAIDEYMDDRRPGSRVAGLHIRICNPILPLCDDEAKNFDEGFLNAIFSFAFVNRLRGLRYFSIVLESKLSAVAESRFIGEIKAFLKLPESETLPLRQFHIATRNEAINACFAQSLPSLRKMDVMRLTPDTAPFLLHDCCRVQHLTGNCDSISLLHSPFSDRLLHNNGTVRSLGFRCDCTNDCSSPGAVSFPAAVSMLLARNASLTWPIVRRNLIRFYLAFASLELPAYVLLWIFDWLPAMALVNHFDKITLLNNMIQCHRLARNLASKNRENKSICC
jgi:hypothetical protein